MSVYPYIGIVLLMLCSAYFSGAEIAFASANRLRLRAKAEDADAGLADRLALYIYDKFDEALTTILIGNNLVNIASSAVATVIAITLLGENYAWVATAVMTVVIITFGEITPKIIANAKPDKFARMVAIPLRALMWALTPILRVVGSFTLRMSRFWEGQKTDEAVTTEDLETLLETAEDEGVIEEERVDLLQNALDFNDVLAYEVLTPRVGRFAVDIADDCEEFMERLNGEDHSRVPVYEDTIDNIIGVLHMNQVYKSMVEEEILDNSLLRELLMPPCFVHKTMPLNDVLAVMRGKKSHMVIVTDEYGGTMGCLTMEDLLEEIVGDIWDETDDVEEEFKKVGRDLYEASGNMRTEDLFDELEIDARDFDDDNATLGGWVIAMMGGYPKVGASFAYRNLTITVKARHKMRVTRVAVQVHPLTPAEAE